VSGNCPFQRDIYIAFLPLPMGKQKLAVDFSTTSFFCNENA